MSAFTLQLPEGRTLEFEARELVVAGFTGRDQAAVHEHVEELARAGVPRPAEVPAFYGSTPSILTTDPAIRVRRRQYERRGRARAVLHRRGPVRGPGQTTPTATSSARPSRSARPPARSLSPRGAAVRAGPCARWDELRPVHAGPGSRARPTRTVRRPSCCRSPSCWLGWAHRTAPPGWSSSSGRSRSPPGVRLRRSLPRRAGPGRRPRSACGTGASWRTNDEDRGGVPAPLDDGRTVYVDGERVADVTAHPAFQGVTRTVGELFDLAGDADAELTFASPEAETEVLRAYMIPRSAADLCAAASAITPGPRSPRATWARARPRRRLPRRLRERAGLFDEGERASAGNVTRFYRRAAAESPYLTYTIIPPQIDRALDRDDWTATCSRSACSRSATTGWWCRCGRRPPGRRRTCCVRCMMLLKYVHAREELVEVRCDEVLDRQEIVPAAAYPNEPVEDIGTLTRAKRSALVSGSRTMIAIDRPLSPEMCGKGCAGSTASGVRTGRSDS